MNIGLSLTSLFRGASQAQVNQQAAAGTGSDVARDRLSKRGQQRKSLRSVGAKVNQKKMQLQAAKIGGVKRG